MIAGLQMGLRKIVHGKGFRGANIGNRSSARQLPSTTHYLQPYCGSASGFHYTLFYARVVDLPPSTLHVLYDIFE